MIVDNNLIKNIEDKWYYVSSETVQVATEEEDDVLSRSTYTEVRKATLNCTIPICVKSYRINRLTEKLWQETVKYIDTAKPLPHPNLARVLGIAMSPSNEFQYILFEKYSHSLYNLLHVKRIWLNLSEILCIARSIISVLAVLHSKGMYLGNLTSRKIMLDGNSVKVLGLGEYGIRCKAGVNVIETGYTPPMINDNNSDMNMFHADIFAFGMLLLEMCTNLKPDSEILNKISSAASKHEDLEKIIRDCLHNTSEKFRNPDEIHNILSSIPTGSSDFPNCGCRILSNRWIHEEIKKERNEAVLEYKTEESSKLQICEKRLEAVESRLVEEQKNFDVVVGQLEFANSELDETRQQLALKKQELVKQCKEKESLLKSLTDIEIVSNKTAESLKALNKKLRMEEEKVSWLEQKLRNEIQDKKDSEENIIKLQKEIKILEKEKEEIENIRESTHNKFLNEKEIGDEAGVRLQQSLRRWEIEKNNRIDVEEQVRFLKKKNKELLRDLKDLDPEKGKIACEKRKVFEETKTKLEETISDLSSELAAVCENLSNTQAQLKFSLENNADFKAQIKLMEVRLLTIESDRVQFKKEKTQYKRELHELLIEQDNLKEENSFLTDSLQATNLELADEIKHREAQEQLKLSRKCLVESCDAPRFLIQESGYCMDCEVRINKEKEQKEKDESLNSDPQRLIDDAINVGTHELVKLINKCSHDLNFMILAMTAISEKSKQNDEFKSQFGENGGLKSIISAMIKFENDVNFQFKSCKVIGFLAFNHDRNRIQLVTDGAAEVLVSLMQSHLKKIEIQEACCSTLTNLSHNSEGNRQKIYQVGGIEVILNAMEEYVHEPSIQERACWVLLTLAGSDEMCEHIAEAGGFGAVIAAMLNCAENSSVQHFGSWTILNLVAGTPDLKEFAKHEGAVEVCEAALAYFPDHEGIQETASQVVSLISDEEE